LRCDDHLVQMYVDGTLDQGEQLLLEVHFDSCPACRTAVVFYKAMLWDLEHTAPPPPPEGLQAVSDQLMRAWEAQSAPGHAVGAASSKNGPVWAVTTSWAGASTQWVRTPIVALALSRVEERSNAAGKSILRGLTHLVLRGGGWR